MPSASASSSSTPINASSRCGRAGDDVRHRDRDERDAQQRRHGGDPVVLGVRRGRGVRRQTVRRSARADARAPARTSRAASPAPAAARCVTCVASARTSGPSCADSAAPRARSSGVNVPTRAETCAGVDLDVRRRRGACGPTSPSCASSAIPFGGSVVVLLLQRSDGRRVEAGFERLDAIEQRRVRRPQLADRALALAEEHVVDLLLAVRCPAAPIRSARRRSSSARRSARTSGG